MKKEQRRTAVLSQIDGINHGLALVLINRGYPTMKRLKEASDTELLAVPGINAERLAAIRARVGS